MPFKMELNLRGIDVQNDIFENVADEMLFGEVYGMYPLYRVDCTTAESLTKHRSLFVVNIVQMTVAMLSVLMTVALFRGASQAQIMWPRNLQILARSAVVFHFLHLFSVIATRAHYLVMFFVESDDPCVFLVSGLNCMICRLPFYANVIGFTLFNVALCAERCVATVWLDGYERYEGVRLAVVFVVAVYLLTFLWMVYIFHEDPVNIRRIYIFINAPTNAWRIMGMFYTIFLLNVATTACAFALLVTNRTQVSSRFSPLRPDYRLSSAFQLRENRTFMAIVFPTLLAHFCVFVLYQLGNLAYRIAAGPLEATDSVIAAEIVHSILCIDLILPPAVFYVLRERVARQRTTRVAPRGDDTDLYWAQFNAQLASAGRSIPTTPSSYSSCFCAKVLPAKSLSRWTA